MSSRRLVITVFAVSLLLGALPVHAISSARFQARNADEASGWHWLSDPGDAATWIFAAPSEEELAHGSACTVRVEALVKRIAQGRPGCDKHVKLTLSSGGFSHRFEVVLHKRDSNRSEAVLCRAGLTSPRDARALMRLCRNYAETGSLRVVYAWQPTEEACCRDSSRFPHPVGVKAESVQVDF